MALEELYTPQPGDEAEIEALAKLAGDEPEPAPEPSAQEPPEPTPDYEAEARKQGWVPKEEFKGNPEKWKPAKEFVQYGDRIGTLKSELEEVKAASTRMMAELRRQQEAEAVRQQREFEAQRQHYEARIAQLRDAKWTAMEEGDLGKARLAEAELDRLSPPLPPTTQEPAQLNMDPGAVAYRAAVEKVHPDAKEFVASGELELWLVKQPAIVQDAWTRPDPRYGIEVLNRFKEETGRKPKPPPNSPVAAPRGPVQKPTATAFASLPESDRKDFRFAVSMGVYKDNDADRAAFAKAWAESRKG